MPVATLLNCAKAVLLAAVATLGISFPANGQTFSLAYISSGDVWFLGTINSAPKRLTRSGAAKSPHFSADGTFIAFQENGAIHAVDVPKHELIDLGAAIEGNFTWAPQDNMLAVWNNTAVYL